MNTLAQIEFHGHTLFTAQHGSQPFVAMRPIVDAVGLDWKSQYSRIKRHPVLSTSVVMMTTQLPQQAQRREMLFIPLSMLNGWLFGVDANRVKREIRDTLILYQRECFDVLAAHWQGAPSTPTKPERAWKGDPERHELAIKMASQVAAEAMRTVLHAVMVGDTNWRFDRWVFGLDYDRDNKLTRPYAKQLERDQHITTLKGLANKLNGGLPASNQELAALASACSSKLLRRIENLEGQNA